MAIDSTHPGYDKAFDAWKLVRDTAFGGGRIVKAEGARYLPMVSGMTAGEYDAYRARANFFNITKRTLHAFVGFIYANNPEIELSKTPSSRIEALNEDATMGGNTLYDYTKHIVRDVVGMGRAGTLVEWASPALENRPFFMRYETEDVINWRYEFLNGRWLLTLLVLRERSEIPNPNDEFAPEERLRYRVLQLRSANGGFFVDVNVFEKDQNGEFIRVDGGVPMRRTTPLPRIPFVFHGVAGDEPATDNVPLDDLALLNISHYHNSADVEQGRHVCGLPTLVLSGFDAEKTYYLGATRAIVSENVQADAKFLQIDANTLSALTGGMEEKERQMAALGARMLESQTSGKTAEAFETVQVRQSGEVSALTDIAIACSETLSRALRMAVWWDDASIEKPDDLAEDVYIELNTEFTTTRMEAPMLSALTQAYQTNALSYEEYFANLQRGGIISSEKKIEDEKTDLEDSPVALPAGGGELDVGGRGAANEETGGAGGQEREERPVSE